MRQPGSRANKNPIETIILQQLLDGESGTDQRFGDDMDAEILKVIDFLGDDGLL